MVGMCACEKEVWCPGDEVNFLLCHHQFVSVSSVELHGVFGEQKWPKAVDCTEYNAKIQVAG